MLFVSTDPPYLRGDITISGDQPQTVSANGVSAAPAILSDLLLTLRDYEMRLGIRPAGC